MKININNHEFETNPSKLPEEFLLKGSVHTGTSIVETVYGSTTEEVLSLANQLKQLNKDFNTVHLYGIGNPRPHIGVKFLTKN
jgi:hypothetical protein